VSRVWACSQPQSGLEPAVSLLTDGRCSLPTNRRLSTSRAPSSFHFKFGPALRRLSAGASVRTDLSRIVTLIMHLSDSSRHGSIWIGPHSGPRAWMFRPLCNHRFDRPRGPPLPAWGHPLVPRGEPGEHGNSALKPKRPKAPRALHLCALTNAGDAGSNKSDTMGRKRVLGETGGGVTSIQREVVEQSSQGRGIVVTHRRTPVTPIGHQRDRIPEDFIPGLTPGDSRGVK
jgi:hypothetical protein